MTDSYKLQQITAGISAVDYDRYEKGIHAQLRMTVVTLPNNGILLHSPVPIDNPLAARLIGIGEVHHIVAPNLNHHIFAKAAKERYPKATLWGAPGLQKKKPLLQIERELEDGLPLGEGLEVICLGGIPFSNECVFRHVSSGSLICTDMVQNIQREENFLTRQMWRMVGVWKKFGQNRYWRFQTKDKNAALQSAQKVLSWNCPRIVMAHGDVIETNGSALLREATSWLSGT
jgi:hypothetical protein